MKLTLKQAWELCLKQWDWIIKQLKKEGYVDSTNIKWWEVVELKSEWCEANGFAVYIKDDCFFCRYAEEHPTNIAFCNCPAKKIDKDFDCMDFMGTSYSNNPFKFYAEIKRLHKLYLKKVKKRKLTRHINGVANAKTSQGCSQV